MSDYKITESPTLENGVFQDRRIAIDRRALLNLDVVINNDRRNYRERRNWRNFALKKDWWLHVNYVDKDILVAME